MPESANGVLVAALFNWEGVTVDILSDHHQHVRIPYVPRDGSVPISADDAIMFHGIPMSSLYHFLLDRILSDSAQRGLSLLFRKAIFRFLNKMVSLSEMPREKSFSKMSSSPCPLI